MAETIVTRGGQITLTKEIREKMKIREGDMIIINAFGGTALISKRDPKALDHRHFLPANFTRTLDELRKSSGKVRLKRLGIIE